MKITDDCMSCGMCAEACPMEAIQPGERSRGYAQYVIDHDKCVNCGMCVEVCPAEAIVEDV